MNHYQTIIAAAIVCVLVWIIGLVFAAHYNDYLWFLIFWIFGVLIRRGILRLTTTKL